MAKQILQRYGTAAQLATTAGTNREIALEVDGAGVATGGVRVMDGVTNGGIVVAPQTLLSNYYEAAAQLTGGNDVSDGIYNGSADDAERRQLNVPAMQLKIGSNVYQDLDGATLDLNSSGTYASDSSESALATPANRAGVDLYVYAVAGTSGLAFCVSANSTAPSGTFAGVTCTENNTRKLGGFHGLCVAVGTISGHELSGYLAGDILPRSVWDAHKHRPESNPEGMVYAGNGLWVDIYLASTVNDELVSEYNTYPQSGGTATAYPNSPTPYYHWYNFVDRFAEVNKRLPVQSEFMRFALGSNEEVNIADASFSGKTTGGNRTYDGYHTAYNPNTVPQRRMISNFGVEDCTGALWQWINETGHTGADASYVVQDTALDSPLENSNSLDYQDGLGRGEGYQVPVRGVVGGRWDDGSECGSRGVNWNYSPLALSTILGARGVSVSKF